MQRKPSFHRFSLVWALAALLATGCMQSLQAAESSSAQESVHARNAAAGCQGASDQGDWQAMAPGLREHGLALCVRGAGPADAGDLQLMVLDSVRASQVLRGPLADGEPVDVSAGPDVSPDVEFNRAWWNQALQRHQLRSAGATPAQSDGARLQRFELAAR